MIRIAQTHGSAPQRGVLLGREVFAVLRFRVHCRLKHFEAALERLAYGCVSSAVKGPAPVGVAIGSRRPMLALDNA